MLKMIKIQILYFEGCPGYPKAKEAVLESVKELGVDAKIEEILIDTEEKAVQYKFLGSPTVRINGVDVEEAAYGGKSATSPKLKEEIFFGCRVYHYEGRQLHYPPKDLVKKAIQDKLEK